MTDMPRILSQIDDGDPRAAEQLLPLVYDELRKLATAKLAQEKPGQTLQPTALVHEAYIRLIDVQAPQQWGSRGHFFVAAAEAMRRILVEHARRKKRLKRGGARKRIDLDDSALSISISVDQLLEIDEALERLATDDQAAAQLVKLKYFVGSTVDEAAAMLGMSRTSAYRHWTYAKAWLQCELLPDTE